METRHKHIVTLVVRYSDPGYSGYYIREDAMEVGDQTDKSAKEGEGSRK